MTGSTGAPKLFISYRWSSPAHEEWVLSLATNLRSHGVDVILDKWHLREGQDAYAFMERMATDPDVAKALLICDRGYSERADRREGGVGTEAQIVSPQVYEKSEQTKFAAAVVEFDGDGKPYLPIYMKNRIYFDVSSEKSFADNYEKIVRWAFDQPFYAVPPVGSPPEFLNDSHSSQVAAAPSAFTLRANKDADPGKSHRIASSVLLEIVNAVSLLSPNLLKHPDADQAVVDLILANAPLREQSIEALDTLVSLETDNSQDEIHNFLESMLHLSTNISLSTTYSTYDHDFAKFFANNALLALVAICLRRRKFEYLNEILATPIYCPSVGSRTGKATDYAEFGSYLKSLEHRKHRLKSNRISIYADLVEQLSRTSRIKFEDILEADFTLYLRYILSEACNLKIPRWYPQTLVYATDERGSFPTYARATSAGFYERLRPLLGNLDPSQIKSSLEPYKTTKQAVSFGHWPVDVNALANSDKLASVA